MPSADTIPMDRRHARLTWRIRWRTALVYTWFGLYLFVLAVVLGPLLWLAGATWDPQRRLARRWTRAFYRHAMRGFCGARMVIENLPGQAIPEPCILVANHQSAIDILLLFQLSPDARCWAKDWPFQKPLLGWLMRLCGHLHVDDPNVLEQAAESIRQGVGMYVFPEGTRSRSGRLGRFHDGAFLLAVQTGVPIVPVAIRGSGRCMTPGYVAIIDVPISVRPLGILYADPAAPKAHLALKRQTHGLIAAALEADADTTATEDHKSSIVST